MMQTLSLCNVQSATYGNGTHWQTVWMCGNGAPRPPNGVVMHADKQCEYAVMVHTDNMCEFVAMMRTDKRCDFVVMMRTDKWCEFVVTMRTDKLTNGVYLS